MRRRMAWLGGRRARVMRATGLFGTMAPEIPITARAFF
jgi:hypothetical protein